MNDVNKLIEDNMNLVYYIVSHQYPTFIRDEDVIQSGMEGLCKAANSYNPEKGLFSTYAGRCIRNEINREFIKRKPFSQTVSLDSHISEEGTLEDVLVGEDDVGYIEDFYDELTDDELEVITLYNRGYTSGEISEILNMTVDKVRKLLRVVKIKRGKYESKN